MLAEFRTESGSTVALYYLKDRLGSTAAVTDGSGNVIEEYCHSAFGSPYQKLPDGTWEALGEETEIISGAVRPEPLTDRLYTGREWDSETGLHHYRARTYSPELGRFLQRDPVGTADQVNPYAYVRNNPMMWTDPTGMWGERVRDGTDFANLSPWKRTSAPGPYDSECPIAKKKRLAKQYDQTDGIINLFNEAGKNMEFIRRADLSNRLPDDWHVQDGSPFLQAVITRSSLDRDIYI